MFLALVPKWFLGYILPAGVDKDLSVEEGYEAAAKVTGLNIFGSLKGEIGDLNKVKRFVKVIGMVNSTSDFLPTTRCY